MEKKIFLRKDTGIIDKINKEIPIEICENIEIIHDIIAKKGLICYK